MGLARRPGLHWAGEARSGRGQGRAGTGLGSSVAKIKIANLGGDEPNPRRIIISGISGTLGNCV